MTTARRLLPLLLAVGVLLAGAFAIVVRHAPATTWALPVQVGPIGDGATIRSVRRSEVEVRYEVGTRHDTHPVRIVDRWHPDPAPGIATAGTRVIADPRVDPDAVAAIVAAIRDREAAWPRPPPFVRALGTQASPAQEREAVTLEVVVVAWCAGMVATAPAWAAGVPLWAWCALLALLAARVGVTEALGVPGVWHSNQHGLDRVADVVANTPPGRANLGLLHGYGYYVVFQPLYRLFDGAVDVFRLAVGVTSLALVAAFLWLRALWASDRTALLGAAVLAASPVLLRIGATESMYVPAMAWTLAALWLFELHLRTDEGRWLVLGLGAAVVAAQTRAELMALVPAWLVLSMLLRRPSWLRTAWRRPVVVLAVPMAGVLFLPRLLEVLATPPPDDLRRTAADPLADPRLFVLDLVAALGVLALPWVRRGVVEGWRRLRLPSTPWVGLATAVGLGAVAYGAWVWPNGGPELRTWQIHAAFDPALEAPWVGVLVVVGAWIGARRDPGVVAWAALAWAGAMWVYLPQYDCLSTFVRTSLSTWPLLAALAAPALDAVVGRGRALGVAAVALLLVGDVVWGVPFLTARYPKQIQADLVDVVRRTVPEGDIVVWLAEADAPDDARARGLRVSRAHLDHWLGPAWTVRPLRDWVDGVLPPDRDVWFVRTADCQRVLLDPRGDAALAGRDTVRWRYLDTSDLTTAPRIAVDGLPSDWIDPWCGAALEASTEVVAMPLGDRVAGSIYEALVGAPAVVGLYRLSRDVPDGAR